MAATADLLAVGFLIGLTAELRARMGGDGLTPIQQVCGPLIDVLEQAMPPRSGWTCAECGEFGHGYMLQDEIWNVVAENAGSDPQELLLCLECATVHLGRPIVSEDLSEARINRPLRYAARHWI